MSCFKVLKQFLITAWCILYQYWRYVRSMWKLKNGRLIIAFLQEQITKEMTKPFNTKLKWYLHFNKCKISLTIYPLRRSLDDYFEDPIINDDSQRNASMHYEFLRLSTFQMFPNTMPFVTRLARSGFYYTGGYDRSDEVTCYSCNIRIRDWNPNDTPDDVHRVRSPQCRHITGLDHSNISIERQIIAIEDTTPLSDQNDAIGSNPHLESSTASRHVNVVTPTQIGESPNTVYTSVDPTYLSPADVQREMYYLQMNLQYGLSTTGCPANTSRLCPANTSRLCPANTSRLCAANTSRLCPPNTSHLCREITTETCQNQRLELRSMQMSYTEEYPLTTVESRLRTFNSHCWRSMNRSQTPQQLAEAGFFYVGKSDLTRCYFCGGGLEDWEDDDDPWIEHAKYFPHCRYLQEKKGHKFIKNVHRKVTNATTIPDEDCTSHSCLPILDKEIRYLHTRLNEFKEEQKRLKLQITCIVCSQKERTIMFLSCGHFCCCEECTNRLQNCPICRKRIRGIQRTFLP